MAWPSYSGRSLPAEPSLEVEILDIYSILRAFWRSGMLSIEAVLKVIEEIEKKDNTRIRDIDSIFS